MEEGRARRESSRARAVWIASRRPMRPNQTLTIRWANLIGPQRLSAANACVTTQARSLTVRCGRRLRVDSTVVETNMHYPMAGRLLDEGVRVSSRLLRRAKDVIGERGRLGSEALRSRRWRGQRLVEWLGCFLLRERRGSARTVRRVLDGDVVPAGDRACSRRTAG